MKMTIITVIALLCLLTYSLITWAANKKVERQKFDLVKKEEDFDIRFYPKAIMASVATKRKNNEDGANANFRKLAGYIFGGNQQEQKIAMTAPVYMESDSNTNRMSFVLPASSKMTELPNPNDSSISLHYSDEGYYACLSFGGFARPERKKEKENDLRALLAKRGYKTLGSFNYLGYNAPWDIFNRENDIIVKIDYVKQ